MFKKVCEWCKEDFQSKSRTQRFCSKVCFRNSRRELSYIKCENCNKKFKRSHRSQRFCCQRCSNLNLFKQKIDKKCGYCGCDFVSNTHLRKYCNDKCAKNAHEKNKKKIIKKCEECNKTYNTAHKNQKFCSLKCAGKRNSILSLSAPTKNGKKKTTDNKKRTYLSRYNIEKKNNKKLKKGEIVHHIDCDPANDSLENLYVFKNNSIHLSCHYGIYSLVKGLLKDSIIEFVDEKYKRI